MTELWGVGDLALAVPFLRAAGDHARVVLLAKPHAAPLLARFAPAVEHVALTVPWTAFSGKYQIHRWPWRELTRVMRGLRQRHFDLGASARRDPRDHVLLALAGVKRRLGFPCRGSGVLLTDRVAVPARPHRAEHWRALASMLGWSLPPPETTRRNGRRIIIHPGAAQPVRVWPRERFDQLASELRAAGWEVAVLDPAERNLAALLGALAGADWFIGNDSGPGHLAALLGVPTFTIFGPQLPELFAPQHPRAEWMEGMPCRYKPCFDTCRFSEPFCIRELSVETISKRVRTWLAT